MKKIKMKFKKGITKLLALAMIASMSQNLAGMEQVAASNVAKSYSFVEKTDLIGLKEGKIIFGKTTSPLSGRTGKSNTLSFLSSIFYPPITIYFTNKIY